MSSQKPNNQGRIRRKLRQLRRTYRLSITNSRTFEERYSVLLTPLNLILMLTGTILFFTLLVSALIAFTPIKRYIPGYPDADIRRKAHFAATKADSLEHELAVKQRYLDRIRTILQGGIPGDTAVDGNGKILSRGDSKATFASRTSADKPPASSSTSHKAGDLAGLYFFPPIRGSITSTFDIQTGHYGVDITAAQNEAIKSTLDGTVIFASWTNEWGHVIQVQHPNEFISIYKHNSVLLKKTGEKVKAGDPIAIIGNTGELTSGPHLHFELWYKGNAVDPQDLLSF